MQGADAVLARASDALDEVKPLVRAGAPWLRVDGLGRAIEDLEDLLLPVYELLVPVTGRLTAIRRLELRAPADRCDRVRADRALAHLDAGREALTLAGHLMATGREVLHELPESAGLLSLGQSGD
ncbi:hypothetical protein AGRA3207_000784 [Actinomadura graeca]|uniref:Uncharacterized protein n=1 Tax=Actinomadura graeca TaxID=2750812 RepID=A0ABX8QNJ6_9ACTN|nr:hypothetical protein [Actinomadura graeca]QXJ20130.1 hypothetical protein AGRA3207_000784 [Actinomadura graeca]